MKKYIFLLFLFFFSVPLNAQDLSPTRKLRRLYLSLTLNEPPIEKYEALINVADPDSFLESETNSLMNSKGFEKQLVDWGHQYIPIPEIPRGNATWKVPLSILSQPCPAGTLHSGAVGFFERPQYNLSDEASVVCNDPNTPKRSVRPWWDPNTTIDVVGVAANDTQSGDGKDCGLVNIGTNNVRPLTSACGCGPNLIYCKRLLPGNAEKPTDPGERFDGNHYYPNSQRRSLHDEPAKLLAFLVLNDRPFSDLILSDYTTVDRGLYYIYTRIARSSGVHPERDFDQWFNDFSSNSEWRETKFSKMHPHILDDPDYTFDPTQQNSDPLGIPAAGVLTMLGPNASWPRPRVRAARWLESVGCQTFSPPETPVVFSSYKRDPGSEGMCVQCHTRLDPAALSFKRIYQNGRIAGIGNWKLDSIGGGELDRSSKGRFLNTMISDTVMTPVTQAQIDANSNARLYDFIPPGQFLLGEEGDGTIGPRGFAKILVKSGAFDQCAVKRAYKRFSGRDLSISDDKLLLDRTVESFVADGRNMKNLIKKIVLNHDKGY